MNDFSYFCGKKHFLYLKVLAIIFVLIGHIGNFSGKTWFTPLGGIGVDLFLILSGFALMKSYQRNGIKNFWGKRFITVYIPFILVESIVAFVKHVSLKDFLLDILFIKRLNPFGWYLQYLACCYFIFWVGISFIKNHKSRYNFWLVISVLSFFYFPNLQAEQSISFMLGILIADIMSKHLSIKGTNDLYEQNFHASKKFITISISFGFIAICLLGIKQIPFIRMQHHLINLIMKVCFSMSCLLITGLFRPLEKMIENIGSISYYLYLVHGFLMFIIENNRFGNYEINSLIMLSLSLIFSFLLKIINEEISKLIMRRI